MVGIYKITNKVNGKSYIGQSIDINRRWNEHKTGSYTSAIHLAIIKYGIENFIWEILEECSIKELDIKEKYYIQQYNTLAPNGYNLTDGGTQGTTYKKLTPETVDSLIQDLIDNKLTCQEIANKYNISHQVVYDIKNGKTWRKDNLTYPLRENNLQESQHKCIDCGKKISSNAIRCPECDKLRRRIIERPDAETLLKDIATNGFVAVGKKYGVTDNAIRKWCKFYGLPTSKKEIVRLYNEKQLNG